ncbi:MAG: hypothetical protein J7497_04675, partial [Chitinophagaceae bacterium]|nr:hypothetical protein [Chitinophagaceae bacterium]
MKFKFRYIKKLGWILGIVMVFLMHTGCKKFVDIGAPVTSSNAENVYTNDATAASVLTGIYIT